MDAAEFDRWRSDAEQALGAACTMAETGRHNWACFLAEQTAQLALKGLLHGIGAGGFGHSLTKLGEDAAGVGLALEPPALDALARLGRHDQPARYADTHVRGPAHAQYTASDAEQALADARLVLEVVDGAWGALDG